jgi:aspartyl-tRNA(Asn)/glutamyl-tRNA(Gln) amidotransferase subunit C
MDIRKIAELAHLEISDAEVEMYAPQMKSIVEYIEQLNELDTEEIEPMLGGMTAEGEMTVTSRADDAHKSLPQKEALSQAPSAVAGHFQVPKVL